MQSSPVSRTTVKWQSWTLVGLAMIFALAPWWRNHVYLRSFFDYGVVMGGAGRIDDGQLPYVDFITPTQTGWYLLNRLAEKIGDGTFQAMTLSGAACTVISLAALLWMLSRRWPLPAAVAVTLALVCATAAQHTLLWYNSWGVVLLAVVAWAGAIAPVLRRSDWVWHALAWVALFLGGINKINMQLMALALAWAWAVRAGLAGRAGWGRIGATVLFYMAGAIAPVLAELTWTGASFATWWHNVIALPAASRSAMVLSAFSKDFLFRPIHDYYGPLLLPQIGLVGVGVTVLTVGAILRKTWREAGWLEKILPLGCGAIAVLGGAVLLTTNMDIAYIGLAGWLALLVALWIGYELPVRGPWFYGALVLPVIIVGAVSWHSAWRGQRSQFGHSWAPRTDYVAGEQAGPDFAYLRGTRLPPEMVESLRLIAEWRRALAAERRNHIYYGPGTEWAAHIWPALRIPGLPLYMQAGSSFSSPEEARLYTAISSGTFKEITVSRVQDLWEERERALLEQRYEKHPLGAVFSVYSQAAGTGISGAPIWFTRVFGGNTDARFLVSDAQFLKMADWHLFLGVTEESGMMQLTIPTNRLQGDVVVRRLAGTPRLPLAADFVIYAQANATTRFERWSKRVELPADQDEVLVPYAIDSSHMPTTFTVVIPPALAGMVAAGWRGPQIQHTGQESPAEPAWFFRGETPLTILDEPALARLLPGAWRPERAIMRKGRVTDNGIELSSGGELWLSVHDLVTEFAGTATAVTGHDISQLPMVRGMWYNGGRLEVYTDMLVRESDHTADFHAWCAEPGGWLVIAVDPAMAAPAVLVRVHKVTQQQ
jgi:hypothetical protein